MPRILWSCVLLLLAACGAPPPAAPAPSIDSVEPAVATWGDEVVLRGKHLQQPAVARPKHAVLELAVTAADPIAVPDFDGAYVLEWTDEVLRFRIPFPANGELTLRTAAGSATARVALAWSAGPAIDAVDTIIAVKANRALEVVPLADGRDVVVARDFSGPLSDPGDDLLLTTTDGATAAKVAFRSVVGVNRILRTPGLADGTAVIVTQGDGAVGCPRMFHLLGKPEMELAAADYRVDREQVASGTDAAGTWVWAWSYDGGGLVEYRYQGKAGWTAGRGPLRKPQLGTGRFLTAAPNGRLAVSWETVGPTPNFPNEPANEVRVAFLEPGAADFGPDELATTTTPDEVVQFTRAGQLDDQGRMLLRMFVGPKDGRLWTAQRTIFRDAQGRWRELPRDVDWVLQGGKPRALAVERRVAQIIEAGGGPPVPFAWPVEWVGSLVVGVNGEPRPVINRGTSMYVLRPNLLP